MSIDVYILIFIYDDYVKSWCYIDHIFLGNFKRILWSSSSWESWILLFNNAMPAQHFFSFFKTENQFILTATNSQDNRMISWNSPPFILKFLPTIWLSTLPQVSIAMTKVHDFMEFATIYIEISSHDLIIYSTASLTGIGFMFLAAVHSYLLLANQ